MIPKILHFIWLGNNKPAYVDFAINAFKYANPDFKINFIEEPDIENPKLELVKTTIDRMLSEKYKIPENKRFIGQLGIQLRWHLLNTIGGIYLDCDTFPIKPFDDRLLKYGNFCVTRAYSLRENICTEIFFLGKDPAFHGNTLMLYPVNYYWDKNEYVDLRNKFFNCTLKYGEHYSPMLHCYIEHFNDFSCNTQSKTCKVLLTKYDSFLNNENR